MPGRILPNLTRAEIQAHNSNKSCYVTAGTKVFDVTDFLNDHPGGADLILQYGGKDVETIMQDELSHRHSEAAYEVLDESLVGFVATEPVLKAAVDSSRPAEILPVPASAKGNEKQDITVTLEPVLEETEVGYHLYKEAVEEGLTWDAEEERAVLRKVCGSSESRRCLHLLEIDWYILPCFCITQGLAYLDKIALNNANLFGIKT